MPIEYSPSNDVRHTVTDGVLLVTIDRAEKRNPLSLGVLEELRRVFTAAANDFRLKLAVVTGAGSKAFCAGGDLTELSVCRGREEAEALATHGKAALDAIRLFPVPVIARLNGVALGGGAELALACDVRFAASSSTLGFVHGRLCISPPWGGGQDLVRMVGPAKALYLMASATVVTAEEGAGLGLIDEVCPVERSFEAWFDERVSGMLAQPARVLRAYKSIALASLTSDRSAAMRLETESFCDLWCHEDHWNAVDHLTGGFR